MDQFLESLTPEVIYFLLFTVFSMLKSISVTQPISRADLQILLYLGRYSNTVPCHSQELYFAIY